MVKASEDTRRRWLQWILLREIFNLQITADGGIDCQNDPKEQELHISPLICAEIILAMQVLSPGMMLINLFKFDIIACIFKIVL